jgi:ABC-type antimicrobial peptide transport system permease subunit
MPAYVTEAIPRTSATPSFDEDAFVQQRHQTWRKFKRHRLALTGAFVLTVMVLGATLAPWLSHFDPNAIDSHWLGSPLAPGQFGHWLGTDEIGRDLYTRILFGARISLTIAIFAVLIEVLLGTLVGAVAGFWRPHRRTAHAAHGHVLVDPALAALARARRHRRCDFEQGVAELRLDRPHHRIVVVDECRTSSSRIVPEPA